MLGLRTQVAQVKVERKNRVPGGIRIQLPVAKARGGNRRPRLACSLQLLVQLGFAGASSFDESLAGRFAQQRLGVLAHLYELLAASTEILAQPAIHRRR